MSKPPSFPPPRRVPIAELKAIFGISVVYLKLPQKSKKRLSKWGHLQVEDMTPQYLADFKSANIAVVLGDVSGGICAIDIDDDKFVEWILEILPALTNTFQTFGSRGRVFWVRCQGSCPQSFKLKSTAGEPIGEFRSNGNYSVVYGIHPNGNPYKWLAKNPVVEISSDSIGKLKLQQPLRESPKGENPKGDNLKGSSLLSIVGGVGGVVPTSVGLSGLVLSEKSKDEINRAIELGAETAGNNRASFYACCALINIRDVETLNDMTIAEKRYFAEQWFQRLKADSRTTKTKTHYYTDIFNSIQNAKRHSNMNSTIKDPVPQAWINAQTQPFPAEAYLFDGDETMQRLIALCYQLHILSGKSVWYLARDKAGKTIGLDSNSTRNLGENFNALINCGILEVVTPYDKAKRQATSYRYIEQSKASEEAV